MPRVTSAIATLSLAVLTASGAQDPVPPPVAQLSPPVLRITVLMIQVDAVVTDSAGKHVAGLRPEDFEILQDGVPQKLTYFSYEPGALKWRFSGRTGLVAIAPLSPGAAPDGEPREPQILDYGYPMSALGALGTIEQVIRGMKGLPGRKSIVFFSDGMRMDSEVNASLDKVTDMANRSAVSLYTVDPGGLRARARERHQDVPIFPPTSTSRNADRFPTFPAEDDSEFGMQEGLDALARRTGGLFYRSRNDIVQCVSEATDDQLGYYLLGYSPREGTFDKDAAKAKFRRVTVRVRRPGLTVRWKSGFHGVPDQTSIAPSLATPRTREQQLADALASPFTATGLKVRLTSAYNETKKTGAVVQSLKVRQMDAELTMVEQENKVLRSLLERMVEHRQKSHAEMVSILTTLVTKLPINDIGVIVSRLVEHNMHVNEVCAALAKGKMDDNQLQPVILKVLERTKD